jgi:MFS family permease
VHPRTRDAETWQPTVANQLLLALYWFSVNVQTSSLMAIVVPVAFDRLAGATHTAQLARVATAASLLAMIVAPLAGAFSDRQRVLGGRRRPLLVAGAAANAVGLGWMASAPGLGGLVGGLLLATVGQNASQAAYQALLPDLVPARLRGSASGYMGAASLVGTIAGLALAGLAGPGPAYVFMIATLVAGAAATALAVPEAAGVAGPAAPDELGDRPATRRDYAVAFAGRTLIMLGFSLLMTFVLYFLQDVLHLANPGAGTAAVAGLALVGGFSDQGGGRRGRDEHGRRRRAPPTLPTRGAGGGGRRRADGRDSARLRLAAAAEPDLLLRGSVRAGLRRLPLRGLGARRRCAARGAPRRARPRPLGDRLQPSGCGCGGAGARRVDPLVVRRSRARIPDAVPGGQGGVRGGIGGRAEDWSAMSRPGPRSPGGARRWHGWPAPRCRARARGNRVRRNHGDRSHCDVTRLSVARTRPMRRAA